MDRQHRNRRSGQAGFTLVELCLGLVVTSLVMGAVAAFTGAMGATWKSAQQSQSVTLTGTQAALRLQKEIRASRIIGAVRAGSSDGTASGAAVLLWRADTNGDGFIQGAEVELLEHDTAADTIEIYPSGQGDATTKWQWTVFTSPAVFANFKTGRTHHTLVRNVSGAVFAASGTSGTTNCPSLSFALKLVADDPTAVNASGARAVGAEPKVMMQYGVATLRAPLAQPNY